MDMERVFENREVCELAIDFQNYKIAIDRLFQLQTELIDLRFEMANDEIQVLKKKLSEFIGPGKN
jgi:hypothetical protein